jgi:hypothetical protein
LTLECWVDLRELTKEKVLVDSLDAGGRGVLLATVDGGAVRIGMNDGRTRFSWESDRGVLKAGSRHHVVAIVDAGPRIVTFVIDGVLCDGGKQRQFGWGRWKGELGDVTGAGRFRVGTAVNGEVTRVRVYDRYLRTSEAVSNYHAGP